MEHRPNRSGFKPENLLRPSDRCVPRLALLAALSACGDGGPVPSANRPPTASIVSGAVEGGETSYTSRFFWEAFDPDGAIAGFQFALDPPAAFTEEEIAHGGPGIVSRFLRGAGGAEDTTRVQKDDGGTVASFDWIHTTDFSRRFLFSTGHADSMLEGSVLRPRPRYSGTHALYLRAVDDGGLVSESARMGFTATTVTPTTVLEEPWEADALIDVADRAVFRWHGADPDGPVPAAFEYKLVNLKALGVDRAAWPEDPERWINDAGRNIPWTRTEEREIRLEFDSGAPSARQPVWVFAVRAIDAAGAADPFIGYHRTGTRGNAIRAQALNSGAYPRLTLRCAVGDRTLRVLSAYGGYHELDDGEVDFEFAAGLPLNLEWSASVPPPWSGTVEAFNWGVDIPDLGVEDPGSGWQGWATITRPLDRIRFQDGGVHYVYLRARTTVGVISTMTVRIDVAPAPSFDRELLLIDDFKDSTFPRDPQHDDFWARIFQGSGRFTPGEIDPMVSGFGTFGTGDLYIPPIAPELALILRYRLILWDSDGGTGYDGYSGLLLSGPVRGHLGLYLALGGKLWITGRSTVAAMIPGSTGRADYNYPKRIVPGSFPWDFLRMYSADVRNDKDADNRTHGLFAVDPLPEQAEILPRMEIDQAKLSSALRNKYGPGGTDFLLDGLHPGMDPKFTGVLDSLYVFRATGPQFHGRASAYDGRLTAYRWHDPDPAREQGRVMWFGFPVYWFFDAHFQETFNHAIDWFREETPPVY